MNEFLRVQNLQAGGFFSVSSEEFHYQIHLGGVFLLVLWKSCLFHGCAALDETPMDSLFQSVYPDAFERQWDGNKWQEKNHVHLEYEYSLKNKQFSVLMDYHLGASSAGLLCKDWREIIQCSDCFVKKIKMHIFEAAKIFRNEFQIFFRCRDFDPISVFPSS